MVRIRAEPGHTDVWIRHDDLQEIWKDFQTETTEEKKTRKMLKILQKEERESRKQWKKNKQILDALMGRDAGEQEISSDELDEEEGEEEKKTERRRS